MKKFLAILLAFMLIATSAFAAVTYTVQSRERGTDDQGANYVKTRGIIVMDASYQCNTTTNNCGYAIRPATLGMNSVSMFQVDPQWATTPSGGSVILFKYHAGGPGGSLVGAGVTGPTLRAYYLGMPANYTAYGLVSMPSYSLADLTAVPFQAIGT